MWVSSHKPEFFTPLFSEEHDLPSLTALCSAAPGEPPACPEVVLREGDMQLNWNLIVDYCFRSFIEFV